LRQHLKYRTLHAFRCVYEAGSVTRAAAQLNVTQPAVSQILGGLERSIGFALFERNPRTGLIPTAGGRIFYEHACRTLDAMASLESVARDLGGATTDRLRVAVSPELAAGFADEVSGRVMASRAAVEIVIEARAARDHPGLLRSGKTELCLSAASWRTDASEIESQELFELAAVAILPSGHRLAALAVLTANHLARETMILPDPSDEMRGRIEAAFAEAGSKIAFPVETAAAEEACAMVAAGRGVAIVSPCLSRYWTDGAILARRFLPLVDCSVSVSSRQGVPPSRLAIEFCRQALELGQRIAGGESNGEPRRLRA